MDLNNEYVTSVKKENNLGVYRIHTIWKNDSFRINIASKDAAWSGKMTPEAVKELSCQLQLDSQTYIQNCKDALTTIDEKPDMKYIVDNGSFVWKKLVDEDSGISIKLGSVRVEPTNFVETIQKIVDVSLTSNKNLQEKLSSLNEEKEKLVLKNNELFSALESAKACKVEMENNLYSNFLDVLNSKKKKILELQNQLENKKSISDDEVTEVRVLKSTKSTKSAKAPARPPAKAPTKNAPAKAPTRRTRSSKKASDNEAYEMDTDNDSDSEVVEKKKRRSTRLSAKISNSNDNEEHSNISNPSNSQTSVIPESNNSAVNECSVEDKVQNVENDSDSTVSDESLANYANCNDSRKNENGEKAENDRNSPKKLSQVKKTQKDMLEFFYSFN